MMVRAIALLRKGEAMKRLFAMLLILGGVIVMTAGSSSAARFGDDSSDPRGPGRTLTRIHNVSDPGGINRKSSCSSDNGDICSCGPGKLCISGADGCTCMRPN
jgi:hypothetical protein